jgi:tetrahydromethanopterin S-methyltransferase subunit C
VKTITKLWIFIAVLAALTPVGLMVPEHFKAGAAWGEWGADEIKKFIGYVPEGMGKLSDIWAAAIPDYGTSKISYIVSAILGIIVVAAIAFLFGKFLGKKE